MTLQLLWTDQCLWLLLLLALFYLIRGLQKEQVRQACTSLLANPLAIGSGLVLCVFLLIGLADSIHYRTTANPKLHSLLDTALAPVGESYEKTYSAPLALTLLSSETRVVDNKVVQFYPRLKLINQGLQDLGQRNDFVVHSIKTVMFAGLLLLCCLLGAQSLWTYWQHRHWRMKMTPARISFVLTLFALFIFFALLFQLSRGLHVLGTGKIGQDIFYYAIKSIRTGLVIGLLTTLIMLPFALILGVSAGYFGGLADDIIQYIYTTLSSIPGVLLIAATVLSMQTYIANHPDLFPSLMQSADARLLVLCLILGVTSWTSLCRLLRAESMKLKEVDYVLAARALGSTHWTILRKHLLPNVMHIVIITLVLDFSFLVLAEAVLSYVGVGVSPLTISWGNMINSARLELARDPVVWWPIMAAFSFMFILVLASNLFADAVRDAFDPRKI